MHEFDFIARMMRPLTEGHGDALGLADDAAVMAVPEGYELVLTKDVMQEGIHFFGDEPARLLAKKLLRTNLSDLAAMGAKPYGYMLGLGLPASIGENWLVDFATGLREDNAEFNVFVLGGDTSRTKAHLALSLTALGMVPKGRALTRSGAKVGDKLYVSGTLGDGALGLRVMRGEIEDASGYLRERYLLPRPCVALGQSLIGSATAAMDISDGLLQDAHHLAKASGVGLVINKDALPLSQQAQGFMDSVSEMVWDAVLAGGDDYELLVTIPDGQPSAEELTCIGFVAAGEGVSLVDKQANEIPIPRKLGYNHF